MNTTGVLKIAICKQCKKKKEIVEDNLRLGMICNNCSDIHYKELLIKELQHKTYFWKGKIEEANYHLKRRESDIKFEKKQLKKLEKKK